MNEPAGGLTPQHRRMTISGRAARVAAKRHRRNFKPGPHRRHHAARPHAFDLHFTAAPDKVVAAHRVYEQHRQEQLARQGAKAGDAASGDAEHGWQIERPNAAVVLSHPCLKHRISGRVDNFGAPRSIGISLCSGLRKGRHAAMRLLAMSPQLHLRFFPAAYRFDNPPAPPRRIGNTPKAFIPIALNDFCVRYSFSELWSHFPLRTPPNFGQPEQQLW